MLRRVGITGIRKPLAVQRTDQVVTLATEFSVSVDLPSSRKGSDLSRNAILLAEIVDQTATRPVSSVEGACAEIAGELLVRHPYAKDSEISARAEYFLPRGISEDRRSYEDYTLLAEARAERGDNGSIRVVRGVGGEAVGMTACPCAMAGTRARLTQEFPLLADPSFREMPMITHNHRNRTQLFFELPGEESPEADEIISAIESAQSSPTYAILKRGDEAEVVLNAHRHPKFVEDVLRDLLAGLGERFRTLPDDVYVRAQTVSEESIHKYNVFAAHSATLGELRANSVA
jgi:GTP cyclohydrolase-4